MKLKMLLVSSLAILVILVSGCVNKNTRFTYDIVKPTIEQGDTMRLCYGADTLFIVPLEVPCEPEGESEGICLSNEFTGKLLHYVRELEIRVEACN